MGEVKHQANLFHFKFATQMKHKGVGQPTSFISFHISLAVIPGVSPDIKKQGHSDM